MSGKDKDDDLDFTKVQVRPEPSKEKIESVRAEASTVSPQLARTGFYVAMGRRAGDRVVPRNGERHVILVVEDVTTRSSRPPGSSRASHATATRSTSSSTARRCLISSFSTYRFPMPTDSRSSSASAATRASRSCRW